MIGGVTLFLKILCYILWGSFAFVVVLNIVLFLVLRFVRYKKAKEQQKEQEKRQQRITSKVKKEKECVENV